MLSAHSDTPMRGRLVVAGRITLDTWFEGDIACSELEIGPDGYILGTVCARRIVVEGQIVGTVHAGNVVLKSGAFIEGDIHHTAVKMDSGATVSGRVMRFPAIQFTAELLALEAQSEDLGAAQARTPVRRVPKPAMHEAPRAGILRTALGLRT